MNRIADQKSNKTRGFTLVELLVAITVGLIVIASLMSLVVMMNSYLIKRMQTTMLSSELYNIEREISDWFYSYDTDEYDLRGEPTESLVYLKKETNDEEIVQEFVLRYDFSRNKIISSVSDYDYKTYTLIRDVNFYVLSDDVVKCTVTYGSKKSEETGIYSFILTRRAQYAESNS